MSKTETYLPTLYKKTNTGAIQYWRIAHAMCTDKSNGAQVGSVITEYGQQDTDKPQTTEDIIREGKNLGRANETSPYQQAQAEAKAKWEKQIKKGYSEKIEDAHAGEKNLPGIDPMLAHSWEKQGKSMPWPCYVQPKLDGLRAICVVKNGGARFYSRTRKIFNTLPHLAEQVETLCKLNGITDAIFDGELYAPMFKDNFNEIVSRIKRDDVHEDALAIQYHIYDLPSSGNANFEGRNSNIKGLGLDTQAVSLRCPNLVRVQTILAVDMKDLTKWFERFLDDGYEGLMARDPDSKYEGKRSKGLLKYKTFQDDEFKIVGVQEGKGKLMGHAGSFVCLTKDGKKFNAKLKGELGALKEYFENFDKKYCGHNLTVQFFNLTPDGLPRFPVGLRLRPDGD